MPFSDQTSPPGIAAISLRVRLDDDGGQILTIDRQDAEVTQRFRWSDIRRVCFQCGRLYQPDLILLQIQGIDDYLSVPLTADGGPALMGQLVGRGLMPDDLVQRALGSADGGLYCWPEPT